MTLYAISPIPPLSSILLGCEQIGVQSVKMLQAILEGRSPEEPHLLIPPIRIMERQSTDILAIKERSSRLAISGLMTICFTMAKFTVICSTRSAIRWVS